VRAKQRIAHDREPSKINLGNFFLLSLFLFLLSLFLGGAVASWLVRSFPDGAVRVRALAGDIVLCS